MGPVRERIDRAIRSHGFKVVFLLRLSPIFPFAIINYTLGITRVRFIDYFAGWVGEWGRVLHSNAAYRGPAFSGDITIAGDEPHLPYQRPPLSKAFLSGEISHERLHVKAPATYDNANIRCLPNTRVTAIDRVAKTVTTADGRTLGYGKLVLATGGRPRLLTLPDERIHQAPNLHYLRTIGHVDALLVGRASLVAGRAEEFMPVSEA